MQRFAKMVVSAQMPEVCGVHSAEEAAWSGSRASAPCRLGSTGGAARACAEVGGPNGGLQHEHCSSHGLAARGTWGWVGAPA